MATQDNSIIPITSHIVSGEQEQGIDARALHNFLGVDTRFNDWVSRRIEEYGFVENQDFVLVTQNRVTKSRGGNRKMTTDYFLTLEMAKELAMVEKNEKGREARRYFIECERRAKQPRIDPEFLMIHKSVLRDTGKALVWMGDYGVTSLPYRGQIPQYQVEGAVKEKQMISVPVEDWMTICNSVYAVYKVFGDAFSYSINHNYQPLPATLSIPCSIASQANKAMGLIYTHTFKQVGGAA